MANYEFTNKGAPSSGLTCLGFQQLTVSTVSLAFTVPANTQYAFLHLDAQPIRYRLDGGTPTAAIGNLLAALDTVWLSGADIINKARVIRSGGVDGILNIHYFG